ncbi:head GIN domain-containing protein [Arcicella lustrica]|uniref:Head GIN domain-containing protein n=1 Tax=Arcicella lustrica TaxID=2984196 RepID=A0ABU5SLW8_9BACT|nr:head GIN domain-containing protein [Arcicella sp. DC25W]MEA5428315.1 head GIN domain-containing protein [Arcicella sp. DC25W]
MKNIAKSLSIVFITLFSVVTTFAQLTKENRSLAGFKTIRVTSGIDLYIKQGNTQSVIVNADKDKINDIVTEVKDGGLSIYVENSKWGWFNWNSKPVKVYVTIKDLAGISATGGSDVYSENKLDLIKLNVSATGGSDVKLELDADELTCQTTGGSDVTLVGTATVFKASSTGGSDLKASDLRTSFCSVSSTGGSDAYVWAEKEISITATGGSDVYHKGNARVVKSSSSGGSDIHKR